MNEDDTVSLGDGLASWTIGVEFTATWSQTWPSRTTAPVVDDAPHALVAGSIATPTGADEEDCCAVADEPFADLPLLIGAAERAGNGTDDDLVDVEPLVPAVKPLSRADAITPTPAKDGPRVFMVMTIMASLLVALGWRFMDMPGACALTGRHAIDLNDKLAAEVVARRIVRVESNGDANAKNPLSSATGAGQFLDGTWLDMIRAYRPDLSNRQDTEILALRYDPDISREMVARFAEENAAMLIRRCLPVTPGTLYLSHFAGGGGAAAVLSAPDHADAATTMAEADSTGRTTRQMIVTANPFLMRFTVADLRRWAERKMAPARGRRL